MTLFTVGHGTRSTEELARLLVEAGVGRLADVRRHPGSRRHPHLGREALAATLPGLGVAYEWRGEALGGRRPRRAPSRHPAWANPAFQGYADHMDTPEFRHALDRLVADAAGQPPLAVLCAETLWWRCHRSLIADAALLRGVDAVHLLAVDATPPHPLHPAARADEDGWPGYDVGCDRALS